MAEQIQKTKAQRVERLKREKNAWGALTRSAHSAISLNRFRLSGRALTPPQYHTIGVATAPASRRRSARLFLWLHVRIRISMGYCWRAPAENPLRRSRREIRAAPPDLTVRQNVQLHWVTTKTRLPCWMSCMPQLTTLGSCVTTLRNIVGCPLAGVDACNSMTPSPAARSQHAVRSAMPSFTTSRASSNVYHRLQRGAPIPRSTTLP